MVIANPPYDREQKDPEATAKRKGGIARYGVPGVAPLMKAVLDPLTAAGLGKHAKNAYNDYVYFWCWATWQAVTKQDGPGVVALITASSYLDGVSLGGLRSHAARRVRRAVDRRPRRRGPRRPRRRERLRHPDSRRHRLRHPHRQAPQGL